MIMNRNTRIIIGGSFIWLICGSLILFDIEMMEDWIDIPANFFGGMVLMGLIDRFVKEINFIYLFLLLCIWEIFFEGIPNSIMGYNMCRLIYLIDTVKDLIMGLLGGIIYLGIIKKYRYLLFP